MAKTTGLGQRLYLGGYDLSGDIGSLGRIGGGPAALDVTGIDKSAFERIGGVRDGGLEFNAWFNDAAGQAHPVLAALPQADVSLLFVHSPAIGGHCAGCVAKQVNYDGARAADGSLAFTVQAQATGSGLEWGEMLTAGKRTDSTATNGSSLDYGATIGQTSSGLSAYLQVFSFTGTTCTVAIQDSADGATGWANVTGASFAAVTTGTPQAQRIQTSAAQVVKRYLRVATTGTFTSITFAVGVTKHLTATL